MKKPPRTGPPRWLNEEKPCSKRALGALSRSPAHPSALKISWRSIKNTHGVSHGIRAHATSSVGQKSEVASDGTRTEKPPRTGPPRWLNEEEDDPTSTSDRRHTSYATRTTTYERPHELRPPTPTNTETSTATSRLIIDKAHHYKATTAYTSTTAPP